MFKTVLPKVSVAALLAVAYLAGGGHFSGPIANAQNSELSALDYHELTQLTRRYAYGIDTCGENGYEYANVFTTDGQFIDNNSDAGFAAGGNVLAQGREALAELVGGGSRGCAEPLIWTGWSHIMVNQLFEPTNDGGATGRIYLVQMGMEGPGSIARHGGYEDTYIRTSEGWKIKTRTHVRNRAWFAEGMQTPDLN